MSTRRILGRAGSENTGSITFNSPATWVSPPRLLNVTVTGVGAAGEPGQVGNAGTGGDDQLSEGNLEIMELVDMLVTGFNGVKGYGNPGNPGQRGSGAGGGGGGGGGASEQIGKFDPMGVDILERMDIVEMPLILMAVRMHPGGSRG